MKYKNLIIYGGTSEISYHLIKLYYDECEKFIIFCTNKDNFLNSFRDNKFKINFDKFDIFEINLIKKLGDENSGVFWVAGVTGNSEDEYVNITEAKKNLEINFVHPVLILNEISKKLIKQNNSFIAVFTSVAGLRGRKKQLFYSPGKAELISFLSGLRQKLTKNNILVSTIIPGYMNTKPFKNGNWTAPKFLISEPEAVALKVKKGIQKNKEIIFINIFWQVIMIIVKLIPEKIYKKLSF